MENKKDSSALWERDSLVPRDNKSTRGGFARPRSAGCPFGRHARYVRLAVGLPARAVAGFMPAARILPSRGVTPNDRPFSRRMQARAYGVGPRPGFSPGSLVELCGLLAGRADSCAPRRPGRKATAACTRHPGECTPNRKPWATNLSNLLLSFIGSRDCSTITVVITPKREPDYPY